MTTTTDNLHVRRMARRGEPRSASPTRRAGIGCGLRVADPGSVWVPEMCGFTTRPAAPCSRPSSRLGTSGALNDVAITHDAVYVTDSFNAQVVVIPLPTDGSLPSEDSATLLPVSGVTQTGGPNLNGIVAKSGMLLVGETSSGNLFRVDPDTAIAVEVDLGDVDLPGPDCLELRGNTLYVVGGGLVTVVRLGAGLASGVVLGVITDPGEPNNPLLDVPTTATVAAGRLWVVNARFTTPPTPDTEYWITPTAAAPRKRLNLPRLPAIRQALSGPRVTCPGRHKLPARRTTHKRSFCTRPSDSRLSRRQPDADKLGAPGTWLTSPGGPI
jgi:hypothetical protein